MISEVLLSGQRKETNSDDFFRGRVVNLNGMLSGIGVRAFERYGGFNFLESNFDTGAVQQVNLNKKLVIVPRMNFSQLWDDVLTGRLLQLTNRSCLDPWKMNLSQEAELDLVREWTMLEDVGKNNLEVASCNAFLATGNSFPWEKDPELLAEMTNSVVLIGKAHRNSPLLGF